MNTGRTPPVSGQQAGICHGEAKASPPALTVLSLFAGIGGFDLGLERAGMRVIAQCEIDPFCRKVLKKHWPDVPCFEDIRTLRGEDVGPVDVICGGYPCQPFSAAGKRRGAEDDRHLWPEMFRLVRELRPAWVIGENVAGHVSMGLDDVLSDLEGAGYAARPFVIPACAVDAPHRRDRIWIIANSNNVRCVGNGRGARRSAAERQASGIETSVQALAHAANMQRNGIQHNGAAGTGQVSEPRSGRCADYVAHAHGEVRSAGRDRPQHNEPRHGTSLCGTGCEWSPEPDVGRVAHGIPNRVDRLRALGNAVVPPLVEVIGTAIMEAHHGSGFRHK